MERRMLMTTTASRGTLRVTVRAASLLGAAAPALLAMFRPCDEARRAAKWPRGGESGRT